MSISLLPFGILLCLTAAGLLLPVLIWRTSHSTSRAESVSAVLRDKLAQVARDRETGLIGVSEAAGAEAEISRELIAASREAETELQSTAGKPQRGGWVGIALIATLALGGSIGIYQVNGSSDMPGQPLAAREAMPEGGVPTLMSEHEDSMVNDAIVSLRARLEKDPENVDQWRLLARSYSAVGAYNEAAAAYARLIELAPMALELRGDYGEALIRAEDGFIGPKAVANFEHVLAHVPDEPRALYYLAMRDAQNGESLKAARGWARILRIAPADATYRPAIRQVLDAIIVDAGLDPAVIDIPAEPTRSAQPGPSAGDVAAAAALPEDQQLDMIRSMVARLDSRLSEEPGDIDGWLRLARSRAVLGEPEEAVAALERALTANPGNQDLQSALDNMRDAVTR